MSRSLRSLMVFAAPLLFACSDVRVEDHATYADAQADGEETRAWLPGFVPASAFEIREVHSRDSEQRWLRFKVPAGDTTALAGASDLPLKVAPEAGPPRQMGRWSAELRDPPLMWQQGSRVRTYQFAATPTAPAWCLAFDHATHEVFAWSCGARLRGTM